GRPRPHERAHRTVKTAGWGAGEPRAHLAPGVGYAPPPGGLASRLAVEGVPAGGWGWANRARRWWSPATSGPATRRAGRGCWTPSRARPRAPTTGGSPGRRKTPSGGS